MLHYGITQIDGKPRAVVCFGFAEVRKLIDKGHPIKFRAFHNSESAKSTSWKRCGVRRTSASGKGLTNTGKRC